MLDSKQTKPLSWLNELDLAINRGDLSSLALLQSGVAAVWRCCSLARSASEKQLCGRVCRKLFHHLIKTAGNIIDLNFHHCLVFGFPAFA